MCVFDTEPHICHFWHSWFFYVSPSFRLVLPPTLKISFRLVSYSTGLMTTHSLSFSLSGNVFICAFIFWKILSFGLKFWVAGVSFFPFSTLKLPCHGRASIWFLTSLSSDLSSSPHGLPCFFDSSYDFFSFHWFPAIWSCCCVSMWLPWDYPAQDSSRVLIGRFILIIKCGNFSFYFNQKKISGDFDYAYDRLVGVIHMSLFLWFFFSPNFILKLFRQGAHTSIPVTRVWGWGSASLTGALATPMLPVGTTWVCGWRIKTWGFVLN